MYRFSAMHIEQTQILTRGELARVLQPQVRPRYVHHHVVEL